MGAYRAVFFDWMLTLADYPSSTAQVEQAHRLLDRAVDDAEVTDLVDRLDRAGATEEVQALLAYEDCSFAQHRQASELLYERAGIDPTLAEAMYGLLGDPSFHAIYPEVPTVLAAIAAAGIRVAVISDIHVDLRRHAELAAIDHLVDEWILSFEHGVQKPDLTLFRIALDAVGVSPEEVLMVGDRVSHDGAATELGIDTLILPARCGELVARSDRLKGVYRLVGA